MVWVNNAQKGIVVTPASDHQAPSQTMGSPTKKARPFWRRSAGSDASDKSSAHRESFRCMDSKMIEEAFASSASSRDRYEAASPSQPTAQLRPCRLEMDDTGPLMGALNARAHLLQQREQQAFRQQAAASCQRPGADRFGAAAAGQVPPVPPVPEQYRRVVLPKF